MVKNTFENATVYEAPGHHGVVLRRFHGKEETGAEKFWVGMSTFEPGGGAGWAYGDNPCEKFYYILEGEMTVRDKEGNEYKLGVGDTMSFPPNEERYFANESDKQARVVVAITYPGV